MSLSVFSPQKALSWLETYKNSSEALTINKRKCSASFSRENSHDNHCLPLKWFLALKIFFLLFFSPAKPNNRNHGFGLLTTWENYFLFCLLSYRKEEAYVKIRWLREWRFRLIFTAWKRKLREKEIGWGVKLLEGNFWSFLTEILNLKINIWGRLQMISCSEFCGEFYSEICGEFWNRIKKVLMFLSGSISRWKDWRTHKVSLLIF